MSPTRHVWLLTAAFALAGGAFAVGAPLFQAPDEPPHVDLVRHYADHPTAIAGPRLRIRSGVEQAVELVGLPQGGPIPWPATPRPRPAYPRFEGFPHADADATGCHTSTWTSCQNYHYVHPPTYYELAGVADRALGRLSFPSEVLGLRLLGVLLVAPVVPLTYLTGRRVWPGTTGRPLAAATLVACFAPLAANAAAVNNDALTLVLAAGAIAAAAAALREPSVENALVLGVATGAGLLVKSEFVAVAAVAALVAIVVARALAHPPGPPPRAGPSRRPRALAAFAGPTLIGSAWWIRDLVRFHAFSQPGSEILQRVRPGPWNHTGRVSYTVHHLVDLVGRFWGLYGQSAVEVPRPWRIGLDVAVVLMLASWLAARRWGRPSPVDVRLALLALFPMALAAGALHASFTVYRTNGEVRGLLGRYLYPSLPVLAVGAVGAAGTIARRARRARSPRRVPVGLVLSTGTVVAATLGLASFVRAAHGFYGTRDTHLLLARAVSVSAVPSPGRWLAVVGAAWASCVVAAAVHAGFHRYAARA